MLPGVRAEMTFYKGLFDKVGVQFDVLREVSARLPFVKERHCSASASVLLDREMGLDAVRTGLSMYGYRPAPWCGTEADLRPVMSIRSRIARVLDVERGATVGYGRTWAAPRHSRVGLVMCGYADGYRRAFGNRDVSRLTDRGDTSVAH